MVVDSFKFIVVIKIGDCRIARNQLKSMLVKKPFFLRQSTVMYPHVLVDVIRIHLLEFRVVPTALVPGSGQDVIGLVGEDAEGTGGSLALG